MTIDREMLAAYAEGQLDAEETAHVEAAIAADPMLADEVAAHRALRDRLRTHFAPVADMPVPDRLLNAVRPAAEVIDLTVARQARTPPPRWIMGGAIAASLVVGLVLGTQIPGSNPIGNAHGQLVAQAGLDEALTTQLASADANPVRIPLSFKSEDGRYCRVFDTDAMAGIACRTDKVWVIERLHSSSKSADTQYRQAGSVMGEIMAAAQGMANGGPLALSQETVARDNGWK